MINHIEVLVRHIVTKKAIASLINSNLAIQNSLIRQLYHSMFMTPSYNPCNTCLLRGTVLNKRVSFNTKAMKKIRICPL